MLARFASILVLLMLLGAAKASAQAASSAPRFTVLRAPPASDVLHPSTRAVAAHSIRIAPEHILGKQRLIGRNLWLPLTPRVALRAGGGIWATGTRSSFAVILRF